MAAARSRTAPAPRPAPRPRRLGEPQELTTTADHGNRKLTRVLYRSPSREDLRGTELDGRTARDIDAFYADQALKIERDRGRKREVVFKALPNGTYRVDLLEPLPPMPNIVRFADVYPAYRDELADGLKLILGMSEGGPLISDADTWPHAIIGGSIGGGKTGFLYSLMAQIGDRSPAIVRLALGDLAATGLDPFKRLPHTIGPLAASLPELLALAESVSEEMSIRQTFFRSTFEVRQTDGSTLEIDGFNDVRYWNRYVTGIGRPDLALPRLLTVVDEWKMAMNNSREAKQLVETIAGIERIGRKWGMRVWLIAQQPKRGTAGDETFPSDIMTNSDTRIALAKGADQIFWQLILRNRKWSEDRERLVTSAGEIPPGRGMLAVGGAASPFQALWLSDEPDVFEPAPSSELTRLVRRQISRLPKPAELPPAARLLRERPYALAKPGVLVIDPSQPGDAAISIREGSLLGSSPSRQTPAASSFTGRWGAEQPRPAAPPTVGEDLERSVLPRMPRQAELLDLSAHVLLRALFVWQHEAWDRGEELVGVSLRNYRDWLGERDLEAGNTQRLTATLNVLERVGVLTERQHDQRRRLDVLPYSSAVAQLDDWLASGGEAGPSDAGPVGEDEADDVDDGSDESALRGGSDADLDDEEDSLFADAVDDRDPDLLD